MVLTEHWPTHAWLHVVTQHFESLPMVHVTQSDEWAAKQEVGKPALSIGYRREYKN
jgi:hypothetical protein